MDNMVLGLVTQEGEDWDNIFSENVINRLFETDDPDKIALDLVALNIQRGRDHGLPGYTAYREELGNPKPRSFDDLDQIDSNLIEKLKNLYRDVDDIDLFAGMFLVALNSNKLVLNTIFSKKSWYFGKKI